MRQPLASILRPKSLNDIIGQKHLIGPSGVIRKMAETGKLQNMILWGPTGCGKTTLSKALALETAAIFKELNATTSGVKDIRQVIDTARKAKDKQTIIFADECHRWSKSQQDILLPAVEDGTITLIGATTEKPKFAVNSTVISRCSVYELKPLSQADLCELLVRIKCHYEGFGKEVLIETDAAKLLMVRCSGDARKLVTVMETIIEVLADDGHVTLDHVNVAIPDKHLIFDKNGNEHFDSAAAYQNCIQNSDENGAIYWLAQWLASGEDPAYITRRMLISAFEDCATNPIAPLLAMAACFATERTGPPECHIPMALATIYMAQSERDKSGHDAIKEAVNDVMIKATIRVPEKMRAGIGGYFKEITKQYVGSDLMGRFVESLKNDGPEKR